MNELTKEKIKEMQAHFERSSKNEVAQCAVVNNGIFAASENLKAIGDNNFNFSIDIDSEIVTNQNKSGRCWMFACLNVLRFHIEQQYNIENFELSQNYTYFWDKLEKTNYFYSNILKTASADLSSREVKYLLNSPQQDGGDWNLIVSLIEKYGVVPSYEMNETNCSITSADLNTILNSKLRKDALILRKLVAEQADEATITQQIAQNLQEVYEVLSITLGTPPQTINFNFRTQKNTYMNYTDLTPLDFYTNYVDLDLKDYVGVINVPTEEMPYNQLYEVAMSDNMVGGTPNKYLNLPMNELKKMTITQIKTGEPVWFGCDVLKYFDRQKGIMSTELYHLEKLLGIDFISDKGNRFNYRDSLPTHAMVFGGVNLIDNKPTKWKVENSWGRTVGDKGFFVMDDQWMDNYVFEVVIRKDFLTEAQQKILKQKPVLLPFWNPMNPIA